MQDDITGDVRDTKTTRRREYWDTEPRTLTDTTEHNEYRDSDDDTNTDDELSNPFAVAIIEYYLYQVVEEDGLQYFKSREIADATGLSTKLVATLIHVVDDASDRVTIEKWAYTSATTWRVETTD